LNVKGTHFAGFRAVKRNDTMLGLCCELLRFSLLLFL